MTIHSLCATLLAACSLLAARAAADTIHVPGDAPTIQAGVDLALPGDTVLVAPGVYVENVVIDGKGITLASALGAEVTEIRAPGGTGVTITTSVPDLTAFFALEGFTITGGTGTPVDLGGGLIETRGGGVRVQVAQEIFEFEPRATVRDCVIVANTAADAGGGMHVVSPSEVVDCVFDGNTTQGDGGGLWFAGGGTVNSSVTGCSFVGNVADGNGGGYALFGSRVSVDDGEAIANSAGGDGGGGFADIVQFSFGTQRMRFVDNVAGGVGGGLAIERVTSSPFSAGVGVGDCAFIGNEAASDGGGLWVLHGADLAQLGASVSVERTLAVDNEAGGAGGGFWLRATSPGPDPVTVDTSTLVGNRAVGPGDAVDGAGKVTSSIVWDPGADPFGGTSANVTWTQVEGGWPGVGNGAADPLFIDAPAGDYGLRGGSPCIDSGDPAADLDADGSRRDRGALPFQGWVDVGSGLAGAAGTPVLFGEGLNSPNAATTLALTGAAPLASVVFVTGFADVSLPFKGGTLVPSPDFLVFGFQADAGGALTLEGLWSPELPPGNESWLQLWIIDATGPAGWSASNALKAVTR